MNKENAKDYLPFVIALSEGKAIQGVNDIAEKWEDYEEGYNIKFNGDPKFYRVKPDLMEFYAITNDDKTDILSAIYKTREEAQDVIKKNKWHHFKIIVHMREVE